MRTFLFGDVHGELQKLEALLDKIPVSAGDRLIFLGDIIDRGPQPKKTVERILELRSDGWDVVALMGNHEQMLLALLMGVKGMDLATFLHNGGETTYLDYRRRGGIYLPRKHLEFFKSMPPYYEGEDFIAVHAGLRPGVPLDKQAKGDLFWIQAEFLLSDYDFGKIVIHGHTTTPGYRPEIRPNRIGIDTAACFGGRLTCVSMPDRLFYSAA